MSTSTDGTFTSPSIDGAKQTSWPLQAQGDYYATLTKRPQIALAANYDPIIEQRNSFVNLLTYSDDLSNGAWTQQLTSTTATSTDPEGLPTASKVTETAFSGGHEVYQTFSALGNVQAGIFLKAGERSIVKMVLSTPTPFASAIFDLSAGTATATSGTAAIKKLLNGWYWCTLLGSNPSGTGYLEIVLGESSSSFSYLGIAGYGVYAWHATVVSSNVSPFPAIATTAATRSVTVPPVDDDDPISFLVEETEPDAGTLAVGISKWARLYARVPTQNVVPTSIQLAKPSLSGSFPQIVGDFVLFQPDSTRSLFDSYERHTVTSDGGAPGLYPTAGTYTLSFDSFTSGSLSYAATAGTVQTALNAMTSVSSRGGMTVTGSYNTSTGFDVAFTALTTFLPSSDTLTVSSGSVSRTVNSTNNGFTQSFQYKSTTGGTVTGGSFSISCFGLTIGPMAHNTSAFSLQEGYLNVSQNVINHGGCTVTIPGGGAGSINTGTADGIQFTINFNYPAIIGTASSLTPSDSTIAVTRTDAGIGRMQTITFQASSADRPLYAVSHGITAGDTIFLRTSPTYYSGITRFTVADDSNVVLQIIGADSYAAAGTILEVGARIAQSYNPGLQTVRAKRTTDFYLPGYSPGIASSDDIVLPISQSDGEALLAAIFGGDSEVNWKVGDLDFWKAPILAIQKVTFDAADVN